MVPARRAGKRFGGKKRLIDGIWLIGLLFSIAISIGPYVWMTISSLSRPVDLMARPIQWVPESITFENYRRLLLGSQGISSSAFLFALRNSFIVSLATTAIAVAVGAVGAYPFSRLRFAGKNQLFYVVLFAQLLPPIALLIPLYVLMSQLGLLDTLGGLILVYLPFSLPFSVWVMRGYYDGIPADLESAAFIDGCTPLQALWRVILPLAAPGMAATAIFAFLQVWNEFFFAVVFTSSRAAKTVPVVIAEFSGRFSVDYGAMAAAGVLGSLVPVALALIFQKGIIRGLTAGGVKG